MASEQGKMTVGADTPREEHTPKPGDEGVCQNGQSTSTGITTTLIVNFRAVGHLRHLVVRCTKIYPAVGHVTQQDLTRSLISCWSLAVVSLPAKYGCAGSP